ncbi:hypothetical protein H8S95_17425 [Pontibacter sp. KCTC 32443]|uniref:hypothetical protein n=1 Tax=Pontibacter TaxID=323449 RepID=UPI00164ED7E1|nr:MULTISPECIES: hypothetical protein [Pontibacter]MBC5775860.1 hypothetical protein [Pontibacter sp. KCTC 32443]
MVKIFVKWALCFLIMLFIGTMPAMSQIKQQTEEKHKKERNQYLREAEKTESTYKETHLNTDAYTFKKGEAARKRVKKRDERRQYKFDETGKPLKKKSLIRKKATKKQATG